MYFQTRCTLIFQLWGHWLLFRFIQGIPVSKCISTDYWFHWKKDASLGTKNTGPPDSSREKILLRATAGARLSQYFHLLGHGTVQAEIQSCRKGDLGVCVLMAFLLPAEAEHGRGVCYRAQLVQSLSPKTFFLTENNGINLTCVPFLAAVEHGEVSISALGAVSSCGPNKKLECWYSCCEVW